MDPIYLNFPTFYNGVVKGHTAHTQYNAASILLVGQLRPDSHCPEYIDDSAISVYVSGEKPIRANILSPLQVISQEEAVRRMRLLGFQDVVAIANRCKVLLSMVAGLGPAVLNTLYEQLKSEDQDEEGCSFEFLAAVYIKAIQCKRENVVLLKPDVQKLLRDLEPEEYTGEVLGLHRDILEEPDSSLQIHDDNSVDISKLPLNFPVFYKCAIAKKTNLPKSDCVSILLTGYRRGESIDFGISDKDASSYTNGKKAIPKRFFTEITETSIEDIKKRIAKLELYDVNHSVYALRSLLSTKVSLHEEIKENLLSIGDTYEFLAHVFLTALRYPRKEIHELTPDVKDTIFSCSQGYSETNYTQSVPESMKPNNKTSNFSTCFDERFIGTFYGYYFSVNSSGTPIGAILKIYKAADDVLQASLMTGIRKDEDMTKVRDELFHNEPVTKKLYDEFYKTLKVDKRRCYYYEGIVEVTDKSVLIIFHGCDTAARKLIFTLNTSCFPKQEENANRPYAGGLAFMMQTSDSPFDTRFYKMGLLNVKYRTISLDERNLEDYLLLTTHGKDVRLTPGADRIWYELAMQDPDDDM